MLKIRVVWLVVLFLLGFSSVARAIPLPPPVAPQNIRKLLFGDDEVVGGIIHTHSTFSDGLYSIKTLAKAAKTVQADFIVITDHLDTIELLPEQVSGLAISERAILFGKRLTKDWGIDKYIEECQKATEETGVVVVPGIEVTLGGPNDRVYDPIAAPGNRQSIIHILGIGLITTQLCQDIKDRLGMAYDVSYQGRKSLRMEVAQAEVARIMEEANLAVVIAHPYLDDPISDVHYTFYKNQIADIDGVEFFNEGVTKEGNSPYHPIDWMSLEALGLINRDSYQGPEFKTMSVSAGADFHGLAAWEISRWKRFTVFGIKRPFSRKPEMFWDDCRMIRRAIESEDDTILAFSENCADWWGNWGNNTVFQEGKVLGVTPEDGGLLDIVRLKGFDPDKPFYAHLPDQRIMRSKLRLPKEVKRDGGWELAIRIILGAPRPRYRAAPPPPRPRPCPRPRIKIPQGGIRIGPGK